MSKNSDKKAVEKNVCTKVVANNLCIGCGICAAVCPKGNLDIRFNEYGEYNSFESNAGCSEKCNLCLKVCPFYDNEDEDTIGRKLFADIPDIKHTSETGYYLESFVGYSKVNNHRENGASGGMATWTLEALLKEKLVNYVICVSPNDEAGKLFKFKICNSSEEVRACSRSCYYPVETSEVLKYILEHEGRYVIIGLPCVCKAVRLVQEKIQKLRDRIRFVFGLVCGQTKSKLFTEYICAFGGGNPHEMQKVVFRVKDENRPAFDFGMRFTCESSGRRKEGAVFWTEGIDRIWCDRYFTPNPCNFCDDVFAECADAVFMDAWLPGYSKDAKGHNIVIVRNSLLAEIFARAADSGVIKKTNLNIKQVIRSQEGVLAFKRRCLWERCRLARLKEQAIPQKRVRLCKPGLSPLGKLITKLTWQISQESSAKWIESDKNLQRFEKEFAPLASKLRKLRAIDRYIQLLPAGFEKIRGVLRW